jgi:four helix bundle protein
MEQSNFEKLHVYRLAEKLADEIWTAVLKWEHFSRETVGKQMVRVADSIGANIAEGTGRGSFKDNRRLVRTARGSLNETRYWLRRAHRRGLLDEKSTHRIKPLVDELSPRLNAHLKSIGQVPETPSGSSNHGPRITDEKQQATDNGLRAWN